MSLQFIKGKAKTGTHPMSVSGRDRWPRFEKESCGVEFVVRSFQYLVSSAKGFKEKDLAEALQLLTSSRGEVMTIMEQWLEYKAMAETATARIAEAEREKAEAERERAEAERERAEAERREAEAERRVREEIARGKAEAEKRAEAERDRAEAEQRALKEKENAIQRLLEMGMPVQTVSDCMNVPVTQVNHLWKRMNTSSEGADS